MSATSALSAVVTVAAICPVELVADPLSKGTTWSAQGCDQPAFSVLESRAGTGSLHDVAVPALAESSELPGMAVVAGGLGLRLEDGGLSRGTDGSACGVPPQPATSAVAVKEAAVALHLRRLPDVTTTAHDRRDGGRRNR